jgi:RNA 2',3'-cyclic 3'-phosphodiesterase
MRLFVALEPPVAVVEALEEFIAPVVGARHELRWVDSSRWHVTLCFIGEVGGAERERTEDALDAVTSSTRGLSIGPLRFEQAGRFSDRVLWMGLGGDVNGLIAAADRIRSAVSRAGVSLDARRFAPHVTLARRTRAAVVDDKVLAAVSGFVGTDWQPDAVHLVQSFLGAHSRYETLASWPLSDS